MSLRRSSHDSEISKYFLASRASVADGIRRQRRDPAIVVDRRQRLLDELGPEHEQSLVPDRRNVICIGAGIERPSTPTRFRWIRAGGKE